MREEKAESGVTGRDKGVGHQTERRQDVTAELEKDGLKLATKLRITPTFSSPCLHHESIGVTSRCHHIKFDAMLVLCSFKDIFHNTSYICTFPEHLYPSVLRIHSGMLVFVDDVNSQHCSRVMPACLPAAMLSTMTIMNSNPLEL
ncbi:hypothetical protein STEG23_017908 [Scotinomys teguina]